MTEETKLLRAAIQASIMRQAAQDAVERRDCPDTQETLDQWMDAAEKAWNEYDLHIWAARYAP